MFNKYYQDELSFLREMGAEFARRNPSAAQFLGERGADPDVERLLEGFAFLVGRMRQKLDDELPELTQSLMEMLWPHYLRPVPAMSILQFEALPNLVREPQRIQRGVEIGSVPVDGTSCTFRTCQEVHLLPLTLEEAEVEGSTSGPGHLRLRFQYNAGSDPRKMQFDQLRLFLHGEAASAHALFLQLTRRLKEVVIRPTGEGAPDLRVTLPASSVRPGGLEDDEALLPYPTHAFPGYRVVQEYLALPDKFLFVTLKGLLPALPELGGRGFELILAFARAPEDGLRVSRDSIRLHCTPVVNLFPNQSDPIHVDHSKVEYLVRPGGADLEHMQIFSIDQLRGWIQGTAEEHVYPSLYTFRYREDERREGKTVYYATLLRPSVIDSSPDTYASFVTGDQQNVLPPTETFVADLTCTNRGLPSKLQVGDISRGTGTSPQFARFQNITPVAPTIVPPLEGELHWRLISNLSLNYLSLARVDSLRELLAVYNFKALHDRKAARENELRLGGIVDVRSTPDEHIYRGTPIRGTRIEVDMKEENFSGEGEMVLFGNILNEFFSLYCTLNSFTRLVIRGTQHGEVYEWSPQSGKQMLV